MKQLQFNDLCSEDKEAIMQIENKIFKTYLCQFCGKESAVHRWKDDKCPLCKKAYSWKLAMDLEDEP